MSIKGVNLKESNVPIQVKRSFKVGTSKEVEKLKELLNKATSAQQGLRPRLCEPKTITGAKCLLKKYYVNIANVLRTRNLNANAMPNAISKSNQPSPISPKEIKMTEITRKQIQTSIFGCGGFAMNILSKFEKTAREDGLNHLNIQYR